MLISASFATALPSGGVPAEIVYLPEGENKITPFVDGKPQEVSVTITAARGPFIADLLQASLQKRQADNVRPWLDFEHKGGASSGNPTRFRYVPGKGIMMAADWSNAGKTAIEGKDFSYFSPTFLLGENNEPSGLPDRGPLGALVNEPAFRDIPRIAASDANQSTRNTSPMSKLIFAALAINAAAADAETTAVQKIEAMKGHADKIKELESKIAAMTKEKDKLKKDYDGMMAKAADAQKARAKSLVEAAQVDGRIAPKDDETAKEFLDQIEAGSAFAEKQLARLPKAGDVTHPIVTASAADKGAADQGRRIEAAQGKARAELGSTADHQSVWDRAKEIDPAAFA